MLTTDQSAHWVPHVCTAYKESFMLLLPTSWTMKSSTWTLTLTISYQHLRAKSLSFKRTGSFLVDRQWLFSWRTTCLVDLLDIKTGMQAAVTLPARIYWTTLWTCDQEDVAMSVFVLDALPSLSTPATLNLLISWSTNRIWTGKPFCVWLTLRDIALHLIVSLAIMSARLKLARLLDTRLLAQEPPRSAPRVSTESIPWLPDLTKNMIVISRPSPMHFTSWAQSLLRRTLSSRATKTLHHLVLQSVSLMDNKNGRTLKRLPRRLVSLVKSHPTLLPLHPKSTLFPRLTADPNRLHLTCSISHLATHPRLAKPLRIWSTRWIFMTKLVSNIAMQKPMLYTLLKHSFHFTRSFAVSCFLQAIEFQDWQLGYNHQATVTRGLLQGCAVAILVHCQTVCRSFAKGRTFFVSQRYRSRYQTEASDYWFWQHGVLHLYACWPWSSQSHDWRALVRKLNFVLYSRFTVVLIFGLQQWRWCPWRAISSGNYRIHG